MRTHRRLFLLRQFPFRKAFAKTGSGQTQDEIETKGCFLAGLREEQEAALAAATTAEHRAVRAEKAVLVEEQWRVRRNERMVVGDRRRRLAAAKAEVEGRKVARQEAIRAAGVAKKAELIASFPPVRT